MGVQARIVLYAPDSASAEVAARAAFDRIAELDAIMSDYRQDSELMDLCRRSGSGPVQVSDDLYRVLEIATRVSQQSNGAFDVSVGPLVSLWRQARRDGRLPAIADLSDARRRVGWRNIILDPDRKTVELMIEGMQLDLGGIAKGYASDAAIATLQDHGIASALIEFGGDIATSGAPPASDGWTVTAALADTQMTIFNTAISTSGDTEQFVIIDGRRYSHVVDPRTGLGLTHRIAATVIASEGVIADALSTALTVMGQDAGCEMLAREYPGVGAFVRHAGESSR